MVNLFEWRDILEIGFFIFLFYRLTTWLNKDATKNLLGYFLCYCIIFATSYWMNLGTICSFMIMYSPIISMFFIIMHEQRLQRSFITPRNDIKGTTETSWIDIVIGNCLYLINDGRTALYLIENKDAISHLAEAQCMVNGTLSPLLLRILTTNPWYKQDAMIWINTQGLIRAINATWKNRQTDLQEDRGNYESEYTQLITAHTDSIIISAEPFNRLFCILIRGHRFDQLSAEHAALLIKQHMSSSLTSVSKGAPHENQIKSNHAHEKSAP